MSKISSKARKKGKKGKNGNNYFSGGIYFSIDLFGRLKKNYYLCNE
jgi:hypothetical protein